MCNRSEFEHTHGQLSTLELVQSARRRTTMEHVLSVGLRDEIAHLRCSKDADRSLIKVPESGVTTTDVQGAYEIISAIIASEFSDADWQTQSAATKAFLALDARYEFKLSGASSAGARQVWARFESDKLRVVWSYFGRLQSRSTWSRKIAIVRLKEQYATSGRAPVTEISDSGADSAAGAIVPMLAIPSYPEPVEDADQSPSPDASDAGSDDDLEAISVMSSQASLPAKRGRPNHTVSDNCPDSCFADCPVLSKSAAAVMDTWGDDVPVDHQAHKRRIREMKTAKKRPAAAPRGQARTVCKQPAPAGTMAALETDVRRAIGEPTERPNATSVVKRSFQRGVMIWQVKDPKNARVQITDRHFPDHEHAAAAASVLCRLHRAGFNQGQLREAKEWMLAQ